MKSIFVSYRREDSAETSRRIAAGLARRLGKRVVFIDVDAIPIADDFRKAILKSIERTRLLLVVIGPRWLGCTEKGGRRRLDLLDDHVRAEIEGGMVRDIPILPLLVSGATMPGPDELPSSLRELAFKNAMTFRGDPHFDEDLDKVEKAILKILRSPRRRFFRRTLTSAALLLSGIVMGYFYRGMPPATAPAVTGDALEEDRLTIDTEEKTARYRVDRGEVTFLKHDPEIAEKFPLSQATSPIPLSLNRHHLGDLNDAYKSLVLSGRNALSKDDRDSPQVARDVLSCHNLRLMYFKQDGGGSFEGTSVFCTPSFRPDRGDIQFIPTAEKAKVETSDQGIRVESRAHFGTSADLVSIRSYTIPSTALTTARLSLEFIAEEDIKLKPELLGKDAFRLLTLSNTHPRPKGSERDGLKGHEASVILFEGPSGKGPPIHLDDPRYYWDESKPRVNFDLTLGLADESTGHVKRIELVREPGDPRSDTPSVAVEILDSGGMDLGLQAFLYWPESQPDFRTLDVWLEWLDAPKKGIKAGTRLKVEFQVTASPPRKVDKVQGPKPGEGVKTDRAEAIRPTD